MANKTHHQKPNGFQKAKKKAVKILADQEKLKKLINEGKAKASEKQEELKGVWKDFQTLLRLIKAWWAKEYTSVPWNTIIYATTAVLYFVIPFDLIPDFIPVVGFLDDITIITFVINSLQKDIVAFTKWEKEKSENT